MPGLRQSQSRLEGPQSQLSWDRKRRNAIDAMGKICVERNVCSYK